MASFAGKLPGQRGGVLTLIAQRGVVDLAQVDRVDDERVRRVGDQRSEPFVPGFLAEVRR
jgi:hypothetical protein